MAALVGVGLMLAAAGARAPHLARVPGILVAPELVAQSPGIEALECAASVSRDSLALRFERITADPDREEMRRLLTRGTQRAVVFEWNADTGELAYGSVPEFTLPATRGAAASTLPRANCELR